MKDKNKVSNKMGNKVDKRMVQVLAAVALSGAVVFAAQAGTLENMERERALMIDAMLSKDLTVQERKSQMGQSRNRLVDLERMVLRDQSLRGKQSTAVRKAFENYDLTFLVHASVENNRLLSDQWLEQLGISTKSLLTPHVGRR